MSGLLVPRFHLIGPLDAVAPDDYSAVAEQATAGGCDAVHLRLPGTPSGKVLEIARRLADVLPEATTLIVNDRLDVAILAGAGGVQLGEQSFGVRDSRTVLGTGLLIGRSVHDLDGARQAEAAGADFLLAGHVFATPSKEGQPGRGLDWLAEIAQAVRIPVIALGGITADRVADVMSAGVHGVAVGRELLTARDPEETAGAIRNRIGPN